MARRLPWLIVVLALAGAAWFLSDATDLFEGTPIGRDDAEADDLFWTDRDDETIEREWDEAPRLAGRGQAWLNAEGGVPATAEGSTSNDESTPGTTSAGVPFGGLVKGSDGRPIAGVTVELRTRSGGTSTSVETEANGRFQTKLAAGRYDLLFRSEEDGGLRLPDYVVDGATDTALEFTLQREHRLVVRVVQRSLGIPDARVEATPLGAAAKLGTLAEATTDGAGEAVLERVLAGSYTIVTTLPENGTVHRRVQVRKDTTISIKVPNGVAITGAVENQDEGGPVPEATVSAAVRLPQGTWVTVSTTTDANGTYELDVPKGFVARFEVVADGFAPWPERKQIRTVLRSVGSVAKGRAARRDVALVRGMTVEGRVTDGEGEPVPNLGLSFRPRRGPAREVETDEDGRYQVVGVRADRYEIVVLTDGWFSDKALRTVFRPSTSGDRHIYDVVVHPTLTVQGEVVREGGKPAAGARVWVAGGGRVLRAAHDAGRDLETFTDTNGWWRIADLPPNQGVAIRAALGTLEARPRGLRTDSIPDKPLRLELAATVALRGMVRDIQTGSPMRGARVQIRPSGAPSGRSTQTVTTDAAGTFEALELIPGGWLLTPSASGYLPAKAVETQLSKETDEVEVTLRLDPGVPVAGVILAPDGSPVSGARATLIGTTREGKSVRKNARTPQNGSFRITGLEIGVYRLVVRRSGFRGTTVQDLRGGEDRLQITLKRRTQ